MPQEAGADSFFFIHRKFQFLCNKKPPAGCILRRTRKMSQATAAGAEYAKPILCYLSEAGLKIYIDLKSELSLLLTELLEFTIIKPMIMCKIDKNAEKSRD